MQNVRIFIHILPFGEMRLSYNLSTELETKKKEEPMYIEPLSTSTEEIRIIYEEGINEENRIYKIPETTAGI